MKRIAARHTLIDGDGFAWEAKVIVPWIWSEGDPESYRETAWKPGDPVTCEVLLETPDDPEHWAYGEDGLQFSFASWDVVALIAAKELDRFPSPTQGGDPS